MALLLWNSRSPLPKSRLCSIGGEKLNCYTTSSATAGFVATQAAVRRMIKQWSDEWTKTLESFDVLEASSTDQNKYPVMAHQYEVSLTQEQQQQLLTRRLLQRIAEAKEMILDTSHWFKNLIEDFHYSLGDVMTNRVRENWEILSNYYREKETPLLQYLDDMTQKLSIITDQTLQCLERLRFRHVQQHHEELESPETRQSVIKFVAFTATIS